MRILFVGLSQSVHLARWINQLDGTSWERFLFPVETEPPHADLRNITYFNNSPLPGHRTNRNLRYRHWTSFYYAIEYLIGFQRRFKSSMPLERRMPISYRTRALAHAIKQTKPDIIHSLEIQHAGYITLNAKHLLGESFPKWIVTNWGSDIYLFGRLSAHRERICEILGNCDFYSCECERDIRLARDLGLRGQPLPVFPNAGGFDLAQCEALRQPGPISQRRNIMLKGYQGWAGRALSGLRALERCADLLRAGNYQLTIYSANNPEVPIAAELFEQNTGIKVNVIAAEVTHEEMLRRYGKSRLYIGLSISDAISTSLLEAMVMGAFPIQSCTACADEWITDRQSGLIVPPEDVEVIETAIRRALTDDTLVDQAAELNWETAQKRLSSTIIKPQVVSFYERVYNSIQEKST